MPLRALKSAAPLKHVSQWECEQDRRSLRALKSAAPLKRVSKGSSIGPIVNSPRPQKRGPVEASIGNADALLSVVLSAPSKARPR